jgi:hypothetical protein
MNRVLFLLVSVATIARGETVSGRVLDMVTGEPLARVKVELAGQTGDTATGNDGRFRLETSATGEQTLVVATIGYRPLRRRVEWDKEIEIKLQPDSLTHKESVDVSAGPFGAEPPLAVGLSGLELRNLASVLADDPLRAVQAMPGVATKDEYKSEFSLRGAGFNRVGLYLDGVLLNQPFHSLQGERDTASLTVIEGDTLESVNLFSGPIPVRFADRTAGVLDMYTREGDRRKVSVRALASASNATIFAEGPIGKAKKASWLVGARKSYLEYIIDRTSDEPSLSFGFSDAQVKLSYDVLPKLNLSLSVTDGRSGLDRKGNTTLGLNTIFVSKYHYTLSTMTARFTPTNKFFVVGRASYIRQHFDNVNRNSASLGTGQYGEWVGGTDATWSWSTRGTFEIGTQFRRLRDDGVHNRILTAAPFVQVLDRFRGTGLRGGGYVNHSYRFRPRNLLISAGARFDGHSESTVRLVSPAASLAFEGWRNSKLHLSWAQHAQYPELSQWFALSGRPNLLPQRSAHFQASVEQKVGDKTRLRFEAFNRLDRDLLFQPTAEPRLLPTGGVFLPPALPRWENSQRGYGRGVEAFLQRRTSNGFTGWISYMYSVSRLRDGVVGQHFDSDSDQRHTANLFGSYRLRPTVNMSARYSFGSGFTVPGYYVPVTITTSTSTVAPLSVSRNRFRLPTQSRADFRINKIWVHDRWHITLFAEVINMFNHKNIRFQDFGSVSTSARTIRLSFERTFPVVPSAGVMVEF